MQKKTSSKQFYKYGSVYDTSLNPDNHMKSAVLTIQSQRVIDKLYCFSCPVYIEMCSGMASVLVGTKADAQSMDLFAIHRYVKINPHIYFSIVSITEDCTYQIIFNAEDDLSTVKLYPVYCINRIVPHIRINKILGYYYNIRNSGYNFNGETHNFFELTYVDQGCMNTVVNEKDFELNEYNLLIYGPGQFHRQSIPIGESCSYLTIIFDIEITPPDDKLKIYDHLLNKVFRYDKKIHTLIKDFVHESNLHIPYMNSLIVCILQEIIIRLLQSEFIGQTDQHPITEVRQNYQNEMLDRILLYINDTITEPITVAEVCRKFSLSRSSLQILFKENLQQTPKKYISELKLNKSCQLIRENKYTISEISLMLGFNSIQYFSKAFTQKYNIAPSEYAKQIFKS